MNCNRCQDEGIILIGVKDWSDPIWDSPNARASMPSQNGESSEDNFDYYKPLVMDCKCRYSNPVSNDQVEEVVMGWIRKYYGWSC